MVAKMKKISLKQNLNKIKSKIWIVPTTLIMMQSKVFAAQGSIGTAEVNQATENVKNAIIKLAMPIRRNIGVCKYCYNCT